MPKQPGQSAAQKRIARTEAYAASIGRMFDETVSDILKLKLAKPTEEGVMYSFDGDTMQVRKKVEALLKRLHGAATLAIAKGVEKEWNIANQECDDLVKNIFGKKLFESDRFRAWTAHNEGAMNAFINRSDKGMNLSDRVWKSARQLRDEMEVALTVGMAEGDSAAGLSRQVRQCLNDPDLMFRRFRYKKGEDENGNPIWGRKWKKKVIEDGKTKWIDYDKDSYIPKGAGDHSRGVYKSAAKNAMRVARTETNMAYRRSDYERWQQMSFILGIRIEMSNQHPKPDICDEMQGDYPKNFYFSGWHPMCYTDDTTVLTDEGWKLFADVRGDELILSLNPETRETEWVKITDRQCWRKDGEMRQFKNRSLDCLVTPEHRMVYLNKTDGRIEYTTADDYRKGKGAFYRGCVNNNPDRGTISINGKEIDFDWFCEFMGYYLSDGCTIHKSQIVIAQKDGETSKPIVMQCLEKAGYSVNSRQYTLEFYDTELCTYLKQFGKCYEKYIPSEILNASQRQIRIFLDAFSICDGHRRKNKDFLGSHGHTFHSDKEKIVYFTTSNKMAGNLSELILKVGCRPSFKIQQPLTTRKKDGSLIAGKFPCFRISECKAVTATVFTDETVEYHGNVYDLTLEKNHIMYVARNGKCFWGSNCFCYATPILVSEDEMAKVNSEFLQGRTYQPQGQPVLDTPPNFKQWIKDNRERILDANSLPYWIKDNPMFVDAKKGVALTPDPAKIEALFPKKPVRTQEQADALIKRRQEELAQFAKNEKYAAGVIETARNYSKDIDLTRIEDLNARHQYTRAAEEAKRIEQTIAQIKADEAKLKALIPNVEQLHKDYSILELKASYNSIKKTLAAAKKLNLQDQYSLFEAQANAAGNQLLKDIYTKRLNEVKIDINIERMRPEVASYQKIAASSSIAAFKPIIDQAEIYLNKRLDWAAQDLLDRIKQYEPLLKRYEDMLSYYKTTPAGMGTTKTDSKIGIALKAAEKNMFVKDKYDDVLKEIELAEKTKATNEANQARRAAKKAATATPKAPKEIDVSRATFDELEKELGDDLPVLLKDYKRSVARTGDVDSIYLREAKDIERKFKDFFESQAYGHAVPHNLLDIEADYYENGGSWGASRKGEGIYIKKGIPTNLLVNQYGEKVWSKGWSLKGSGYDESRRSWGHWAYNKQSSQYSKVKKADRLQDNDYYVCGTPMSKDKQEAWSKRKATGYGDTLITLRKERVVATFTYGNSLGQRTIPSLASDPKVCSLDKQTFKNYKAAKYTSHEQVISGSYASYIEMQYLPRAKSGFISPRDFESITFPGNPKKLISQKALDQWKKHGVDIYYADSKGKVVLFQKGDPFITQAEAKARLDSMQNELDNWRKNAAALTNKDISFSELEKHLKGKDYISALSETEKLQRQLADMEKREKAMEKLIPDVKKWHKQFTIDELEAAHVAIQKQLDWLENQYIPKNGKEAVIGKIGRIIGDNQTQKKYSTWEVANQAYARKRDEIVYELRKDTIDDNLQRLRSFKTKDKTFLKKLQDIEDKVKTKSWYELEDMIAQAKDKMMSLSTGNLQKALKLGESTAVKFDPSEFTQDMRDVAKWFNAEGTTAAAMRKAYKEADAYMSKYAQDMWKKLTDEEKKVLWMYTDGSQYINQEILGCYMLRMKSPWGEFRNGLKDANMITSVIEKAPALQEGMWMQSGKSTGAFEGMFGIDIGRVKDLSALVGKEGTSNAFTSCHAASNGYFVKGGNTGAANDIVMSIYMPKGTKGIYMEPFASWGDSKRGLAGYNWDGKKQKTAPSDQVEFLLQRGARFKITKAYVGKDGKWHIDVDLIEQPSMKALNEKLPTDYNWRSIRYPNYTAP